MTLVEIYAKSIGIDLGQSDPACKDSMLLKLCRMLIRMKRASFSNLLPPRVWTGLAVVIINVQNQHNAITIKPNKVVFPVPVILMNVCLCDHMYTHW